jgi:hypothetical protein
MAIKVIDKLRWVSGVDSPDAGRSPGGGWLSTEVEPLERHSRDTTLGPNRQHLVQLDTVLDEAQPGTGEVQPPRPGLSLAHLLDGLVPVASRLAPHAAQVRA